LGHFYFIQQSNSAAAAAAALTGAPVCFQLAGRGLDDDF